MEKLESEVFIVNLLTAITDRGHCFARQCLFNKFNVHRGLTDFCIVYTVYRDLLNTVQKGYYV